ncbi:MAG: hypothetical protein ACNI25_10270 [Halarcobacter sp.]
MEKIELDENHLQAENKETWEIPAIEVLDTDETKVGAPGPFDGSGPYS